MVTYMGRMIEKIIESSCMAMMGKKRREKISHSMRTTLKTFVVTSRLSCSNHFLHLLLPVVSLFVLHLY